MRFAGVGQRWSAPNCAATSAVSAGTIDDQGRHQGRDHRRDEGRRQGDDGDASPGFRGDQESRHRGSHRRRTDGDDQLVTEVLQKMVKQRRESADIYRKNGRDDRAEAEEAEIR